MPSAPSAHDLPCSAHIAGLRPRHLLRSREMTALRMLWMGLVLLGLLGFPQTLAQGEGHVSVQPNFQQGKVRFPLPHPQDSTALRSMSLAFSHRRACLFLRASASLRPEPAERKGGLPGYLGLKRSPPKPQYSVQSLLRGHLHTCGPHSVHVFQTQSPVSPRHPGHGQARVIYLGPRMTGHWPALIQ